jgi:hypothetical protein
VYYVARYTCEFSCHHGSIHLLTCGGYALCEGEWRKGGGRCTAVVHVHAVARLRVGAVRGREWGGGGTLVLPQLNG